MISAGVSGALLLSMSWHGKLSFDCNGGEDLRGLLRMYAVDDPYSLPYG